MKIRHEKWGEVDGVAPVTENWEPTPVAWFKDGADYPRKYGWSEVKEPQYVDVTGEVGVIEVSEFNTQLCIGPHTLILPKGYRAMINEWYAPQDTNREFIFNSIAQIGRAEEIFQYLRKFRKPCLTIEKEQS